MSKHMTEICLATACAACLVGMASAASTSDYVQDGLVTHFDAHDLGWRVRVSADGRSQEVFNIAGMVLIVR